MRCAGLPVGSGTEDLENMMEETADKIRRRQEKKMTTQLYNVYSSREDTFLMSAPMMVISAAFNLRQEATKRVLFELENGSPNSTCHFNGRSPMLNLEAIKITKA